MIDTEITAQITSNQNNVLVATWGNVKKDRASTRDPSLRSLMSSFRAAASTVAAEALNVADSKASEAEDAVTCQCADADGETFSTEEVSAAVVTEISGAKTVVATAKKTILAANTFKSPEIKRITTER